MSFWKRRRQSASQAQGRSDSGQVQKAKKSVKRSPPVAMEVKVLAIEALDSGLSAIEVGELVGVGIGTIHKWRKDYAEAGVQGLCRKASSIAVRRQCSVLEEKILSRRRENPDHGVRRIRDDLRRHEGIEVSAEKVRTVVNESGLGNPPPRPARRPPKTRRFERSCPNAMWQIDIFTFQLKRMYPVYLIGILDDHSRYLAGWGLFRQQNADAVLEVLKGSIGQWGAPREILSDNGRQFVAWRGETRFQKVLRQQGVQHVRSAPQHPMTLGKIERFWQTIWREFLEEAVFASFADACRRLEHWIHYYNHQRPHQGLDGACPADRFYGIAGDVEEAVRQGCQDNSLRLALGQEPQPPLYLLGQLGGADVRVVRKGEEIEVKVGDAVHEVIRMGAPFTIGEDGSFGRAGQDAEVEGAERRGALPGGGAGPQGRGGDQRAVQDVWSQPSDAVPGDGGGGPGVGRGAGAEEARSEAASGGGDPQHGAGGQQRRAAQGAGALEDEVPGGEDDAGPGAQAGPGRAASWGEGEKKETAVQEHGYDERSSTRLTEEDGVEW
ncbi:MAG: DDE-type integrase/transposase/recombinase [Gammaproteobacteria bacterium]|nr:DDE-type integrase/transposase/recombinase [Gammaproteobacteria bacterium]